ncbi:MAG: CDP-glycerol--glycerophosphate glycerophosphotransferase [Gammaproteobacteria bacterium]|nr:CDP-glycerol--glycerophosphate glycerophosphotransferase [Gammaproteobacteria bacterium]
MDNYLFFVSKAYSIEILRPLQQAILARGGQVVWFLSGVQHTLLHANEMTLQTVTEVKHFNPKAVFAPGNWVPDFFPGVKVEIYHGFGIEKKGHFKIRGFFDLYCTHGPIGTRIVKNLSQQYGFFHVTETGWPKMDPLFNTHQHSRQHNQQAQLVLTSPKPLIFYAPTFSVSLTSAPALKHEIQRLSTQGDWHWIVKFHPKMDQSSIDEYKAMQNDNLTIADSEAILPLLQAADVLVSDTSSVVAEFLMLGKPVVAYNPRKPGPYLLTITESAELASAVAKALTRPTALMAKANHFIQEMHPYNDGKSSERVLDATDDFIKNHAHNLKSKPLNIWRKLKARQQLNYYHLK